MPISSQRNTAVYPYTIISFPKDTSRSTTSSSKSKRAIPDKSAWVTVRDKFISQSSKCNRTFLKAAFIILTVIVIALVILAVVLPLVLAQSVTTTAAPTTVQTTTTTTTTTTFGCASPFVQANASTCVNIFIDDNNCGSVGTTCSTPTTHCSAGVCNGSIPTIELTSYTSVWTGGNNGSIDDQVYSVGLPFSITLYNTQANSVQVTTNGVLCFSGCSDDHQEANLPATSFSGVTVFPYWDDLYISSKTWQGIYYSTNGTAPDRILTFEYYLSYFGTPTAYAHFQVIFYENQPNVVHFSYFEVDNAGSSATIGVQESSTGSAILYSYQSSSLVPNRIIIFYTTYGNYSVQ